MAPKSKTHLSCDLGHLLFTYSLDWSLCNYTILIKLITYVKYDAADVKHIASHLMENCDTIVKKFKPVHDEIAAEDRQYFLD